MNPAVRDLLRSVQLADVVDVLLVATVLFAGIRWLRRSSSGSAARRLLALGIVYASVYLVASVFSLYLMEKLLEAFFLVLLIAIVVVFQADIRRLLDRMASWSFTRPSRTALPNSPVEILTEAAAHLAESRTGALIAVRGREPWTSHVQGGIELDGIVSRPLLYSVFHPDSPGHDGAVLMEGDRVVRFAAHLPLATQIPEASRYGGTRHAAALGLAEECDALVIVVSEERGTISVAENGALEQLGSSAELSERLERFWREHHADAGPSARAWKRRTLESAALSLGLATLAWVLFSYGGDTIFRSYQAPIEFRNLPPEWVLESDTVPTALLTLSGSEHAFGRLNPAELAISVDLAQPDTGVNEVVIAEEHVRLPSGLHLHEVSPREVRIVARRRVSLRLPVQVRTLGPLPDSLVLTTTPDLVRVLVPEGMREPPRAVSTEPVDLRRLRREESVEVELRLPPEVDLHPEQASRVEVTLRRRPEPATRLPAPSLESR